MEASVVLVDQDTNITVGLVLALVAEGMNVFRQKSFEIWESPFPCDAVILSPSAHRSPGCILGALQSSFPPLGTIPVLVLAEYEAGAMEELGQDRAVAWLRPPYSYMTVVGMVQRLIG